MAEHQVENKKNEVKLLQEIGKLLNFWHSQKIQERNWIQLNKIYFVLNKEHKETFKHLQNVSNEVTKLHEQLVDCKQTMASEIAKNFKEYNSEILTFKDEVYRCQNQVKDLRDELSKERASHAETANQLRDLITDHVKYKRITDRLDLETVHLNSYLEDVKKIREDITRIRFGLQDLNSNLVTTDNYLDKYLPFRMQNLISETLDSVLDEYHLRRLTAYEKEKYKKMHDDILNDNGKPSFDKSYEGVRIYQMEGRIFKLNFWVYRRDR